MAGENRERGRDGNNGNRRLARQRRVFQNGKREMKISCALVFSARQTTRKEKKGEEGCPSKSPLSDVLKCLSTHSPTRRTPSGKSASLGGAPWKDLALPS